jgi:hypothetical protein
MHGQNHIKSLHTVSSFVDITPIILVKSLKHNPYHLLDIKNTELPPAFFDLTSLKIAIFQQLTVEAFTLL